MKAKAKDKLANHEKQRLVARLVDEKLGAWRAGWAAGKTCALHHLNIHGFESVTTMVDADFDELREALRNDSDSDEGLDAFWAGLVGDMELINRPDFATAFVRSVKEVWEQVRDNVLSELEVRPEIDSDEDDSNAPRTPTPKRPTRRGPSGGRRTRRWDTDRGMGRWE